MAETISIVSTRDALKRSSKDSGERVTIADITGDSSYPQVAGGYELSLSDLGFRSSITYIGPVFDKTGTYLAIFDPATGKLKFFTDFATEVGNGVDIQTVTVRIKAEGF